MRDLAEMFRDKPDRFGGDHPIEPVEPREVYRPRIAAQRALEAKVEVNVEITERELAQGSVDRLAVAAPGEIRFGDRAPEAALFEDGDDVVSVAIRFKVEDERRKPEHAQSRRAKDGALQAGRGSTAQDVQGRRGRDGKIIGQRIEITLNALRGFERPQFPPFTGGESKLWRRRNYNPLG